MPPRPDRRPLTPDETERIHIGGQLARDVANIRIASRPSVFGQIRSEIHAAAVDGLIDAAQRYDPARGVAFKKYARARIRGQITDYLRSIDHMTKHDRAIANKTGVERWGSPVSLDDNRMLAVSLPSREPDPSEIAERMQMAAILEAAASTLPDKLRAVLALYYTEDMTLRQVGEVMGYTESRACQVMGEAHARLRDALIAAGVECA